MEIPTGTRSFDKFRRNLDASLALLNALNNVTEWLSCFAEFHCANTSFASNKITYTYMCKLSVYWKLFRKLSFQCVKCLLFFINFKLILPSYRHMIWYTGMYDQCRSFSIKNNSCRTESVWTKNKIIKNLKKLFF